MTAHTAEFSTGLRQPGRTSAAGFLATLALHGLIGLGLWWSQRPGQTRVEAPRDYVITEMVKLGKPREKFWLPRKVEAPRPQAPPAELKIADDPNAAPAPVEAPRLDDPEISKDLKRALARAKMLAQAAEEVPDEGSAEGSAEGTSNEARQGDVYATKIYQAIKKNWTVPAQLVGDDELAKLVTEIRLKVGADGEVTDVEVGKSSGNTTFDDACIQAVKATGKLPPPPAEVAAKFARGLVLDFEGKALGR